MKRNNKNKTSNKRLQKSRCWIGSLLLVVAVFIVVWIMPSKISYASWVEEDNGIKYLQEDGQYAVGFLDIEDNRYYFDSDGHLVKGKFFVEEDDAYYYSNEEGVLQYGAIRTEDEFFITDEQGRLMTGFAEHEGKRYYFNQIAQMVVGWFRHDGNWYYADSNGIVMTGFVEVDGYRYYLNADGTRVSDAIMEIDGLVYVFNADGSVDENRTLLYPVFEFLNQLRAKKELPELIWNSKLQSCAILRAANLENGFAIGTEESIEILLGNRGVECTGGHEFAFGGIDDYNIDRLINDIQKDTNIMHAIATQSISEIGIGMYQKNNIFYYDIILISKE